ncbi:MAG: MFS transporter [Hyphomicrobiales bacterium]|nr:MFS transporter [Hyphomicrobiales bacterium]MBV9428127.1 MFS transporter [Bradyrhizobiaceae bacterium]
MSQRIFYGWYVVGAIGLVLTTTSGLGFYNLSVLLDAFVRERAFPVALASGATACYFVGSGVGGVIAGWLIDRIDARVVVIVSAVLSALSLAALGFIYAPAQLYLFHLVFGLCYGCGGIIPNITTLARWFEARRSLAISIASTGLSLGGIVITPASAYLIEHHGIASTAPWLALSLLLGVVPATAFVVRPSPQAMGLVPDGAAPASGGEAIAAAPRTTFREARRSRFFAGVAASYFFVMGAQVGAIAHMYRLVKTGGGADIAPLALALLAAASVCGRLAGGWILLKVPARVFTIGLFFQQTTALVVLAFAADKGTLLLGVVLFGLAMGNILMMQPLLLAEAFGTQSFGRIYAASNLISVPGVAGGPALLGISFAATGGYAMPYLGAAAASLLGIAILLLAGPPRRVVISTRSESNTRQNPPA